MRVVSRRAVALMCGYHLLWTAAATFSGVAGAGLLLFGVVLFHRQLLAMARAYLLESWHAIDAEGRELRAAHEGFDARPVAVLCAAAVCLVLIEYVGGRNVFEIQAPRWIPALAGNAYFSLIAHAYWSLFRIVLYIGVPWIVLRLARAGRLRDCGLSTAGLGRHLWIYGLLFMVVLPPLAMMSTRPAFQRMYPFYDEAVRSWGDFLGWELIYGAQFLALEVFFRGFLLHPLRAAFGSHAIFVAALPYCMLHYGKPLPEVFGALAAGIVLGTLSMRTRSIWPGVLIHVSVAWSMDWLAILHKAGFPGNPRYVG